MSDPRHQKEELEVFTRFVEISKLPIDINSIQQPDFPDILCKSTSGETIGFELTKITEETFARIFGKGATLDSWLWNFYNGLPEQQTRQFKRLFSNALITFDFHEGANVATIKKSLKDIFATLFDIQENFEGELAFHGSATLNHVLKFVYISRGEFGGPILEATRCGWVGEPVVPALRKKLDQNYSVSHALEVLLYNGSGPNFPENVWIPQLQAYISGCSSIEPFRKIWVIDLPNSKVAFEYETT